ncbi:MAG: ABC transporter ATP-binding protein [Acetobacteraceae bacterium]
MSGLLEACHVSRVLPGPVPATLVRDVSLTFGGASLTAVTGPSGSGKSSLLYLLGLLDRPTDGDVLVDGQSTRDLEPETLAALRLRRFGFVFQFHFLLPELTVLENVLVPMRQLGGLRHGDMLRRAAGLLDALGMGAEGRRLPAELSGGQRQRTAIARALANDPQFILADEPTGALDQKNGALVFDILRWLAREGRTVIVVTHNEALAATADRQVRLVDGRLDRVS